MQRLLPLRHGCHYPSFQYRRTIPSLTSNATVCSTSFSSLITMGGGNMTNLLSFFIMDLYLRISPPSSVRTCSLGSPKVSITQSLVVWPHSTCLSVSFSTPVYCSSVSQTTQPAIRSATANNATKRPILPYLFGFILYFSL